METSINQYKQLFRNKGMASGFSLDNAISIRAFANRFPPALSRVFGPAFAKRSVGESEQKVARKGLKGVAPLLAGAIYVAITIAVVTIIVQVGNPAVKDIQDSIAIDQAKEMLANLDRTIREVAAEGKGSTRVVPIEFKRGKLVVDESSNQIFYELETKADIVSPGARREIGNLFITANAEVSVTSNETHFIMQNKRLKALIKKVGAPANYQPINLSRLIDGVEFNLGEREYAVFNGSIGITIDSNQLKSEGNGYTKAEREGSGLSEGTIIARINNSYLEYDVYISLRSGDFLEIRAGNFTNK